MYASTSFTAPLVHDFLGDSHPRRLLLQNPLNQSPTNSASPPSTNSHNSTDPVLGDADFDANVVMIISVLLCAFICSLGLNTIIRCALRCSNLVIVNNSGNNNNESGNSAKVVNRGIKKKALKTFPIVSYSAELKWPGLDTECVICLSEFTNSDRVRILPKCNHGFHVRCIDEWLCSHSSCPKCRQCLIETCQKIIGCSQSQVGSSSQLPHVLPVPETVIRIVPLEPEGLVCNYREVN